MAEERPAKRRRFTGDIVTIIVGSNFNDSNDSEDSDNHETETFKTQAQLLTLRSPFFKAALDKRWEEGQSLEISLPEDDPDVVEAYLGWLHDGKIGAESLSDDYVFNYLSKLYVFGEKIQDNIFCNRVIDAMTRTLDKPAWKNELPTLCVVRDVYEGTPEDSPARNFFVQIYLDGAELDKNEMAELPSEFIQDLLEAALKKLWKPPCQKLYPQRSTWYKPV